MLAGEHLPRNTLNIQVVYTRKFGPSIICLSLPFPILLGKLDEWALRLSQVAHDEENDDRRERERGLDCAPGHQQTRPAPVSRTVAHLPARVDRRRSARRPQRVPGDDPIGDRLCRARRPAAGVWTLCGADGHARLCVVCQLATGDRGTRCRPHPAGASAVGPLAGGDPARTAALAAATALLGGVLMLLAAGMRVGIVADFLSQPVLIGYMTGASLILVSTQLGKLFGIKLEQQDFFPLLLELAAKLGQTHVLTLCLGLGFLGLLLAARHWVPKLPGALVIVVVALVISIVFDLERHGVKVIGRVPRGLPLPRLPSVTMADLRALLPGALGIALLTFPDGMLLARAFAVKNRYDIHPTQELCALAVSNLAAGWFQGVSVGASQSRTTVNDDAGGRTQMASLVAVAALALFLLWLTPLLRPLPTVVLGSILIFAGVNLVDVQAYRRLRRISRPAFDIALLVTAGVLVSGVVPGILIGVMLSLVYLLGRLARPTDVVLQEVAGTGSFHDLGAADASETVPGLIAYRFYAPLFFANADHFIERVRGLVAASP